MWECFISPIDWMWTSYARETVFTFRTVLDFIRRDPRGGECTSTERNLDVWDITQEGSDSEIQRIGLCQWFSTRGDIALQRTFSKVWRHFWFQPGEMLLASSRQRTKMLLNIVPRIGKFFTSENYSRQMSMVLRLRSLAQVKVMLGAGCLKNEQKVAMRERPALNTCLAQRAQNHARCMPVREEHS